MQLSNQVSEEVKDLNLQIRELAKSIKDEQCEHSLSDIKQIV